MNVATWISDQSLGLTEATWSYNCGNKLRTKPIFSYVLVLSYCNYLSPLYPLYQCCILAEIQAHLKLSPPGGTSILGGWGAWPKKFASEILVGAPNFASKNISDKYPKFCPLNFRYDPKIETFPNFCVLWWQDFPCFSSYLVNLAGPCPKFCLRTWCEVQAPPDLLIWKYLPGLSPMQQHWTKEKGSIFATVAGCQTEPWFM